MSGIWLVAFGVACFALGSTFTAAITAAVRQIRRGERIEEDIDEEELLAELQRGH